AAAVPAEGTQGLRRRRRDRCGRPAASTLSRGVVSRQVPQGEGDLPPGLRVLQLLLRSGDGPVRLSAGEQLLLAAQERAVRAVLRRGDLRSGDVLLYVCRGEGPVGAQHLLRRQRSSGGLLAGWVLQLQV